MKKNDKINYFTPKKIVPGMLLVFMYDAKTLSLPYWDLYPLSFIIGLYNNGFLGLNLHYLPLNVRKKFVDNLIKLDEKNLKVINTKHSIFKFVKLHRKTIINYSKIKTGRLKIGKIIIKRYLYSQVRSVISVVEFKDWKKVLLIEGKFASYTPMEKVFKDTMRQIKQL